MRGKERIPLHDHRDFNSGGRIHGATVSSVLGLSVGGSSGGGGGTAGPPGADGSDGSGLPWFNVMDAAYGALNDTTTDDTTAINAAIAALISAGQGVLYFPAGAGYKVTAALTTLSVPCTVRGDGWQTSADGPVTRINFTSTTGVLFTATEGATTFEDFAAFQTGGTGTAGAAIVTTASTLDRFEGLFLSDFYTAVDIEDSLLWTMQSCFIQDFRKYGVRIRNTAIPDAGDWSMHDVTLSSQYTSDAGIRQESSGGGRVVNVKVNSGGSGTNRPSYGYDGAFGNGVNTSILMLTNLSIENVEQDAVRLTTTGTGSFSQIFVNSLEVLIHGTTGLAVNASGSGLSAGIISAVTASAPAGSARAAVNLTNVDRFRVGHVVGLNNFTTALSSSGTTNLVDSTGAVAGGIVIPSAPAGELGGTWASPTVDTTHAGSAHADFIAKAIVDAKGDLIAGSAADTVTRVAVGADGTYLKADSGATGGVSWDTPAGGSSGVTVQDEGTPLTTTGTTLNFIGDGVTASGAGATKTIDIPGGGSGIPAGTSFPGSPSTNDQYFRTDRGIVYFYDGTRWLSMEMFEVFGSVNAIAASADVYVPMIAVSSGVWLVDVRWSYQVNTTHSGTQFWAVTFFDTAGAGGATLTSDKATANAFLTPTPTAVGALFPGAASRGGIFRFTKTSTPGTLLAGAAARYRLVG